MGHGEVRVPASAAAARRGFVMSNSPSYPRSAGDHLVKR